MYSLEYQTMSAPTPVMISIIMVDSGSTRICRLIRSPSTLIHCHRDCSANRCDGVRLSRSNHTIAVSTNPVATVPTPTTRLNARSGSPGQSDSSSAPPSGSPMTIQARVVISIAGSSLRACSLRSSLQTRECVHVERQTLAVHGNDEPEPDHHFGGRHHHHHQREDLPIADVPVAGA